MENLLTPEILENISLLISTALALVIGFVVKTFLPKIPNAIIPILTVALPFLGTLAGNVGGMDLGNPIINAMMGGLAVTLKSIASGAIRLKTGGV